MEQITNKLTELVGEKFIAKEILDMKYAMEHKEKMNRICESFKNMTCVILNTIEGETEEEWKRLMSIKQIQTHLIFHYKIETDIETDHEIENYVFAFQEDEMEQYNYINETINNKEEIFLNSEEYIGIYDIVRR